MVQIAFFPFAFADIPNVGCVFTSRRGGVSRRPYGTANLSYDVGDNAGHVLANRQGIMKRLGLETWQECRQVHGDVMHFDPQPTGPEEMVRKDGDGIATSAPRQGIVVKTADCQPVMLAHKNGKHVAGLHVGWRGNRIDFAGKGVAEFCEKYFLDPSDIVAVRGPSLGPDQAEFVNFKDEFGPEFEQYHDQTTSTVNLWEMTRDQLIQAGLSPENVHGMELCTKTMRDTFYSYRRSGEHTGRQAGIIWIK